MEVTYICNAGFYNVLSVAERVIPAVLENNGIKVHYQDFIFEESFSGDDQLLKDKGWITGFIGYHRVYQKLYNGNYENQIRNYISNMADIVLMSTLHKSNFFLIKEILNSGRKVLIGGTFLNICSPEMIRKFLVSLGVNSEIASKNLKTVKGYVDFSTDLKSIIEKWEDIVIESNQLHTIYETSKGFSNVKIKVASALVFDLICPHQKCKFCTRKLSPSVSFIKDADVNRVAANIRELIINPKTNYSISFSDDYFTFTKKALQIFDIVSGPHNFEIQTGLKNLKNKEFIYNINKYISRVKIGVETTTDYALTAYDKGFTYTDLQDGITNVIKYLNRDVELIFNIIIDSPQKDVNGVIKNYTRITEIKNRLKSEGFKKFRYSVYALSVHMAPALLNSKNYRIDRNVDKKYLTGMSYLTKDERPINDKLFIENKDGLSIVPYNEAIIRIDDCGNLLASDIEIMGNDYFKNLFN